MSGQEREALKVEVLKDIKKLDKNAEGGTQSIIQVVSYNDAAPQLVKRQFYRKKNESNWNPGKVQGLNAEDFTLILSKKKTIMKLLGGSDD